MTYSLVYGPSVPLDDEAYHLLNEALEERFGLHFPAHRRGVLEARLQPRLRALHLESFLDYYAYLRANGNDEPEELAKAVTNNETYFFRETDQFEALFTEGLDALAGRSVLPGRLRVLSAGCSSGEEAYTLSFYAAGAAGAGAGTRAYPLEIDAFDLDTARLEIAKRGECRPRSLRQMTEDQIRRLLSTVGPERWAVREPYRERVRFFHGNLVDPDSLSRPVPYDVVFCRNVLIYFSEPALRRAIAHLVGLLRPGGLLFLGHSESIIGMFPQLQTARLGRCIAYRKAAT